jgi:uncharacterized membrane protein YbhN (UPF0104 family)
MFYFDFQKAPITPAFFVLCFRWFFANINYCFTATNRRCVMNDEEFVQREKSQHDCDRRFVVVLCIALLVSLILLAESAYFCYAHANLPAIFFTLVFFATTILLAVVLWSEIRGRRKDDMP